MMRHLFTLIWNRKKQNFLMITEIFFSFIVLFGVLSLGFFYLDNLQKPLGYKYENVWVMNLRWNQESDEEVRAIQKQLLMRLRANKEVAAATLASNNIPYSMNSSNTRFAKGTLSPMADFFESDEHYREVMQLNVIEGRWFKSEDAASPHNPAVITRALRDELFPNGEEAIGKVVEGNSADLKGPHSVIVGVIDAFRQKGEYSQNEPGYFHYTSLDAQVKAGQEHGSLLSCLVVRVKPGVSPEFEETLMKQANQIAKGWTLEIETMSEKRQSMNKITLIPLIIFSVVCGFLIINVALGLFGVLWYNINRRISEIGLRRAIGAASGQVFNQFVGEVLVLATFGIILGILFAAQFPLLQVFGVETGVYLAAMGTAVVSIFLLAAACAAYPSRQAAKIAPAMALHED
jgi:putative ABC transport system permease protein